MDDSDNYKPSNKRPMATWARTVLQQCYFDWFNLLLNWFNWLLNWSNSFVAQLVKPIAQLVKLSAQLVKLANKQ